MNGAIKIVLGLVAISAPAAVYFKKAEPTTFLPGRTSNGHHQIEKKCDACHTPFGGVAQNACVSCHADGLEAGEDSHTPGKFQDPRNAPQLGRLDAAHCVACHREHRPDETNRMSVSARPGFCAECHRDIGRERASHADLAFSTCTNTGCHNFHDNRAVYGDFLAKHRGEPELLPTPALPTRTTMLPSASAAGATLPAVEGPAAANPDATARPGPTALVAANADVPSDIPSDLGPGHGPEEVTAAVAKWETSAHARAGVNCGGCHREEGRAGATWSWQPNQVTLCARCHGDEKRTFLGGKHGMRLAAGLPPMRPADARLPMQGTVARDAHERGLTCNRCHESHAPDLVTAAVERCESCHADNHTRAYRQSPHFALWQAELTGKGAPGTGVSCASCHLPRKTDRLGDAPRVWVDHNQNANLRPVDKMARSVCMSCHGLQFSLTALADRAVVDGNFVSRPSQPARTGFDLLARSKP